MQLRSRAAHSGSMRQASCRITAAVRAASAMALEQQSVPPHDARDPLNVHDGAAVFRGIAGGSRRAPADGHNCRGSAARGGRGHTLADDPARDGQHRVAQRAFLQGAGDQTEL